MEDVRIVATPPGSYCPQKRRGGLQGAVGGGSGFYFWKGRHRTLHPCAVRTLLWVPSVNSVTLDFDLGCTLELSGGLKIS